MTNYKKKYNRLKVEYDMLRRASGKKNKKPSGRASELFKVLQSQYFDKLDTILLLLLCIGDKLKLGIIKILLLK